MKKWYFSILFLIALCAYGQNSGANEMNQAKEASFKLYPNPALNNLVYIITTTSGVKDIVVYDVFGEIVLTDRIVSKSLDISRLVAGVYVLQLTENEKTMTRKLVVK